MSSHDKYLEILIKKTTYTEPEARKILDFMFELASIEVNQITKKYENWKSSPDGESVQRRAS